MNDRDFIFKGTMSDIFAL